jgi:hypothetical protein
MTGYQQALRDQGFTDLYTGDVFADWGAANFLDDVDVADGQYGYAGDELPAFYAYRTHAVFPISASGSVSPHGTDYIRLQDFASTVSIFFDGADSREFRVTLMALADGQPTLVQRMPLDDLNAGTYDFLDADGYEQVIMAVANTSLAGTGSYAYEISETVIDDAPPGLAAARLECHPNPFNPRTEFRFDLPRASGDVRLTVHDLRGREVARLHEGSLAPGAHRFPWTPDDLAAGVYVGRLVVDGRETSQRKVTVVK